MPQRDPEGNDRYGRGIGIGKENICGSGKGICRFPQGNTNEIGRNQLVTQELKKQLDGSIRLKNIIDLAMVKVSCYYLISENAKYASNLRQSDSNGRDYTLFGLNRTDSIEQMEIYNISNPELIRLTREEEDADRRL